MDLKVAGHLFLFIIALSAFDTTLAAILLRIFDPTPTTTATIAVSTFLFAVVVTNGPGGILLRRFYDHHQEHADDIARWLKGLILTFNDDAAVDTIRVETTALSPPTHASKPPVVSSEVLLWIGAHMKTGHAYKRDYFRSEFGLLVTAHTEFERLYREARKSIAEAVTSEVNRFWPEIPKSSVNYQGHFDLDEILRAVWDCLWLREFESMPVTATVSVQKVEGTNTPFRLYWRWAPSRREHTLGEFEAEGSIKDNLQAIFVAQTGRPDLVRLVKEVSDARRLLQTKFETTTDLREKTAWRISRNRDVGGRCDDCPKFWG